ncbi:MAG: DUF2292 domain-containing protein [Campylobacter hyointestinalis]
MERYLSFGRIKIILQDTKPLMINEKEKINFISYPRLLR